MEVVHEPQPRQEHLPGVRQERARLVENPVHDIRRVGAEQRAGPDGVRLERRHHDAAKGISARRGHRQRQIAGQVRAPVPAPYHPDQGHDRGWVQGRAGPLQGREERQGDAERHPQRQRQPASQAPHEQEHEQGRARIHPGVVVEDAEHEGHHRVERREQARRRAEPELPRSELANREEGAQRGESGQQRGHQPRGRELAEGALRVGQQVGGKRQPVVAGLVGGRRHQIPPAVVLPAGVLRLLLAVVLLVGLEPRRPRIAERDDGVRARSIEGHHRAARERAGSPRLPLGQLALLRERLQVGEVVGLVGSLPHGRDQRPCAGVHHRDDRNRDGDPPRASSAGRGGGERAEGDEPEGGEDEEEDRPVPPRRDDPGAEERRAIERVREQGHDRGPLVHGWQEADRDAGVERSARQRRRLLIGLDGRRPADRDRRTDRRYAERAVHVFAVRGDLPDADSHRKRHPSGRPLHRRLGPPICRRAGGATLHEQPRPVGTAPERRELGSRGPLGDAQLRDAEPLAGGDLADEAPDADAVGPRVVLTGARQVVRHHHEGDREHDAPRRPHAALAGKEPAHEAGTTAVAERRWRRQSRCHLAAGTTTERAAGCLRRRTSEPSMRRPSPLPGARVA